MNIIILLISSIVFSQSENCIVSNTSVDFRSIYSIGDTLSFDDQIADYEVCNGSGNYQTGDFFSFEDLSGAQNGGDYKITLISMNATW